MEEFLKKIKRPSNGTWDDVEADMAVFERILLKLPVRNVLEFKSVSKLWQRELSRKDFMVLHRNKSKKSPKYIFFYDAEEDEDEDGTVPRMYQVEPEGNYTETYFIPEFATIDSLSIMSTFNGLIYCESDVNHSKKSYEIDIFICNPATREVLKLPLGQSSVYIPIHGLMYANHYHFYKIFKFFCKPIDVKEGYVQCEVYSSNTGSWKQLGRVQSKPLMDLSLPLLSNHVCVNEKLYWLIAYEDECDIPPSILMVDMDEKFREIQLPIEPEASFLIEFRGCLCAINYSGLNIIIWTFDEENDVWDLVDESEFPDDWLNIAYVESVVAIGEKIMFVYKDRLGVRHEIRYDVSTEIWDEFCLNEDDKKKSAAVFPFFETLLPCSTLTGNASTSKEQEIIFDS